LRGDNYTATHCVVLMTDGGVYIIRNCATPSFKKGKVFYTEVCDVKSIDIKDKGDKGAKIKITAERKCRCAPGYPTCPGCRTFLDKLTCNVFKKETDGKILNKVLSGFYEESALDEHPTNFPETDNELFNKFKFFFKDSPSE